MNMPPDDYIRVDAALLQAFVSQVGVRVGLPQEKASLLGRLLTENDLRGVFSHGTVQIATYARLMQEGVLNNRPDPQVVKETPVSLLIDGDGGLGYFPAHAATELLIAKATSQGIAVALTRNHGHFGAAGLYSRMTLAHDLICFVTSGHQLKLAPDQPLVTGAGGSPMSFSAPADREISLLVDFGAMHDLYLNAPHREEIERLAPGIVFRSLGLGAICQSWGGFLAGLPLDEARAVRDYSGANQGSLAIAMRIDLFLDPVQFRSEMDAYVAAIRELQPLPGFDESLLPGGIEAAREREYRLLGIPIGRAHRACLRDLAQELDILLPWA